MSNLVFNQCYLTTSATTLSAFRSLGIAINTRSKISAQILAFKFNELPKRSFREQKRQRRQKGTSAHALETSCPRNMMVGKFHLKT